MRTEGEGPDRPSLSIPESVTAGLMAVAAAGISAVDPMAGAAVAGLASGAAPWRPIPRKEVSTRLRNAGRAVEAGADHQAVTVEAIVETTAEDLLKQQLCRGTRGSNAERLWRRSASHSG